MNKLYVGFFFIWVTNQYIHLMNIVLAHSKNIEGGKYLIDYFYSSADSNVEVT